VTGAVPAEFVALAEALADAAGEVCRRYFRTGFAVDDKPDATPVTIADREAELRMRALIEARFPAHGIVGEEHGRVRDDAEWVWTLDPIDGTKSFISGVPLFCTLIGLVRGGVPVLGVVDQPVLGERWLGAQGRGTTLNGRKVAARPCERLARATLFATAPDMFVGADAASFERLRGAVKLTRYGADAYAYALVPTGFVDLVCEASLKPHDWCALAPVVEGGGGVMTDWAGARLTLASDGRVLACGDKRVHAEALRFLSPSPLAGEGGAHAVGVGR
jgi:inositol-phosphate phosphatase/L-galactose 1-phosphate phosphatase/histidinol-phosphatase